MKNTSDITAKMNAKSQFVVSRKQIRRMAHIVALLKQNDMTSAEILRDMQESSAFGASDIQCAHRTLRRDIELLRTEYNCPVEFDFSARRYVLYNKEWDFTMPAVMNSNEMLAIVIGEKISRDILPPGVSRNVTDAVNEIIRFNSPGTFLPSGRISALKILSAPCEIISDDIFIELFRAWRTCHSLYIEYHNSRDEISSRVIEPHALVFYDMQWSIRAFCPDCGEWRTFMVGRMTAAHTLPIRFVPDEKAISAISADNYYNFRSAGFVKIRLTKRGAQVARIHVLHSKQVIEAQSDGSFLLSVPEISKEEMLRWTLSHVPGDAVPVAPADMVDTFRRALEKMLALVPEH